MEGLGWFSSFKLKFQILDPGRFLRQSSVQLIIKWLQQKVADADACHVSTGL